jgi:hypothetical protein
MLVQSVVRAPAFDLAYLMQFGEKALEMKEQHHNIHAQAEAWAKRMHDAQIVKGAFKESLDDLRNAGYLDVSRPVTPEGIQQALTSALINTYQSGFGVGTGISFDQWVQGVSLNVGFTAGDTVNGRAPSVGISLAYNKSREGESGRG